jgi:hypothetical protein
MSMSVARCRWMFLTLALSLGVTVDAEGQVRRHGTVIKENGSALEFQFVSCGKESPPRRVRLWRIEVTNRARPFQVLCKRDRRGQPREIAKWRYGTALGGFEGGECPPLGPGDYVISSAGDLGSSIYGSVGDGEFRIERDGSLKSGKNGCEE